MTPRSPSRGTRAAWAAATAMASVGLIVAAQAQTVQSITNSSPDLGNVVSAPSGTTVFRVSASDGTVTRNSGTGARLSSSTTRPLVTIRCGNTTCANKTLNIRVGSVGSPTGRAQSLTNFTISAGSATITTAASGTNPVSFSIAGIPNGSTRTFYVGTDFPISGNDSAAATGNATSGFYVYVAVAPTTPTSGSTAGLAVAKVFRPISLSESSSLSFGKIVRPGSGSGTVTIDATSGARTVTGTGAVGLNSPTPSRVAYSVSGEGGQVFSISVPASFQMTGPGTPLTVSLTSTATGSQTLSSTLGSAGSFSFGVGGSFPLSSGTTAGAYSGTFAVTVQYN